MKKYSAVVFVVIALFAKSNAQPAPEQKESILIVGATAHLGNGTAIERSAVGFSNGKISFVGTADRANQAQFQRIIEAEGQHLYPGFIAANTTLGLSEIGAVRATRDYAEVGAFNPNVRSIIAYDAESMVTPTTITNGVLLAQIVPKSGVLSGTSSVVQLDAWNWEDAAVRIDDGVHLNWPRMTDKSGWYGDFGELKQSEGAQKVIDQLDQFFTDAKNYCTQADPSPVNLRLAAMCDVLNGNQTLYIHADRVRDMASGIRFSKNHNVPKIVVVGGAEAWIAPELFTDNNVGLMISRVHALPDHPDDDIELPYKLPAILDQKNVPFAMQNWGSHERMHLRNLPFNVGTAIAHGLSYERAVSAITLNVAILLGIEKQYGSIEVGKSATLFLSAGDAFDMRGNAVQYAFIDGRELRLENRQSELFNRYKLRYSK